MAAHDFPAARGVLVPSVPGDHAGGDLHLFGLARVQDALAREGAWPAEMAGAPVVAQVSSMWAGACAAVHSALSAGVAGAQPLGSGQLALVWPAEGEVRRCPEGQGAGGCLATSVVDLALLQEHLCQ